MLSFFLVTLGTLFVLRSTLGWVPVLGPLLRVPLLSFWLAAALVSWATSALAGRAVERRRERAWTQSLGPAGTPHAKGKLGGFLLGQGKVRRALPLLEAAAAEEPDRVEWQLGLARARERSGDVGGAEQAFRAALDLDPAAGFGAAALGCARLSLVLGDHEAALEALDQHDRRHGPSPEGSFWRSRAERLAGRHEQADLARRQVLELAARPGTRGAQGWAWRARLRQP